VYNTSIKEARTVHDRPISAEFDEKNSVFRTIITI